LASIVIEYGGQIIAAMCPSYAGTIYKGQGKTLNRTYLYHTEHWRAAASYVALTRQRDSAEIFVARETARDAGQLAGQMERGEVRPAQYAERLYFKSCPHV
jgi:ATP-dependent exoDNAse (exonuclease V) alpha subunit